MTKMTKITKYYTVKECFDACDDEDVPFIDTDEIKWNYDSQLTKAQLIEKDHLPDYNELLSDKWQIKRAEPKVLTHNESFDELDKIFQTRLQEKTARAWFNKGWFKCLRNEELRHPSNTAVEWVNNFVKTSSLQYTSAGGLPINDALRLRSAFEAGERNERLKYEPIVNLLNEFISWERRSRSKTDEAIIFSNKFDKALEQLKGHDDNNENQN